MWRLYHGKAGWRNLYFACVTLVVALLLTVVLTGCSAADEPAVQIENPATQSSDDFFYVYKDSDYSLNHFTPSGYMGDIDDIKTIETCQTSPYSGSSCIKIIYTPSGKERWAGVYWQQPPNNWGTEEKWKGAGYNLSEYHKLTFYARAETKCGIEFMVGGVSGEKHPYGDSLTEKRFISETLTDQWQPYTIDLADGDLSHIISGFGWVTNTTNSPNGAVFYLDEIRYER